MKAWAWMMGGLIVWLIHFMGVYTLSSVADVVAQADDPAWRWGVVGFSLVCLLASGALLAAGMRRLRNPTQGRSRFQDQLATASAGLSLIAMVWQALPAAIGH